MKEFKDYSDDNSSFPIQRQQTFTPVFRSFNENIISRIGVFVAEYFYPPIVIGDVVGTPKVEQKVKITPLLLGLCILVSISIGIFYAIRLVVLYRKSKHLDQILMYFGANYSLYNLLPTKWICDKQEQEDPAAPSLGIAENIATDEINEPAVPISLTGNVENLMNVACDTENIQSNFVEDNIKPCEAGENNQNMAPEPVAATEHVVRKRFVRQPLERKQGTANRVAMARKPTIRKPFIPEPVTRK